MLRLLETRAKGVKLRYTWFKRSEQLIFASPRFQRAELEDEFRIYYRRPTPGYQELPGAAFDFLNVAMPICLPAEKRSKHCDISKA